MWFASAKPPYGTLDAAEWAPSTASKADICSAKGHVRFTPNSDIDCVFRRFRFSPCPLSAKSRHSMRRPSPGLPRGSMARATRSQLELDLPLMLKSVYPMGESSGANNRTCVLCFDLAVLLAD